MCSLLSGVHTCAIPIYRGVDAIVFRISDLLAPAATPKSQVDRHKAKIPPVRISERLFHPHPVIAERIACRKADIRAGREYYDCGTRAWEKITPFNEDRQRTSLNSSH